jgi:hypothetical protein
LESDRDHQQATQGALGIIKFAKLPSRNLRGVEYLEVLGKNNVTVRPNDVSLDMKVNYQKAPAVRAWSPKFSARCAERDRVKHRFAFTKVFSREMNHAPELSSVES